MRGVMGAGRGKVFVMGVNLSFYFGEIWEKIIPHLLSLS